MPPETRTGEFRKVARNRVISVTAALAAMIGLSGCGSDTINVPEGFYGSLAVEEPRAALLARDVLVNGGSAADAAVVTYFALAATLPSSGGLGATGSCLVFDPTVPRFERLEFYPAPAAEHGPTISLPSGPRAMFALQARYGRAKFEELLIEAERLARFGEPVSRALAYDLAVDGAVLAGDPEAARMFRPGGRPLEPQSRLLQIDLAATIGRLRGEGIGAFYAGPMARDFIASARLAGYAVDADRLRDALPRWSAVVGTRYANHVWAIAGQDATDTALAEIALALLLESAHWTSGTDAVRRHLLAEALSRSAEATLGKGLTAVAGRESDALMAGYDPTRRGLNAAPGRLNEALGSGAIDRSGATGFYIVDRFGMAVGCTVGLGAPFGSGSMAPGFGFLLGRPAVERVDGPGAAALLVGNMNASQTHLAVAASGGRPALSALLSTTLQHWEGRVNLGPATAAPRSHFAGGSGILAVDPALPPTERPALEAAGYRLEERPDLARVNGFRCVEGIPRRTLMCEAGVDPRSRGLGFFELGR